jgi:hypothetical protein
MFWISDSANPIKIIHSVFYSKINETHDVNDNTEKKDQE